jgi:hypothetical protein
VFDLHQARRAVFNCIARAFASVLMQVKKRAFSCVKVRLIDRGWLVSGCGLEQALLF